MGNVGNIVGIGVEIWVLYVVVVIVNMDDVLGIFFVLGRMGMV